MSEDLLQQINGRFDLEEVLSKTNKDPKYLDSKHIML